VKRLWWGLASVFLLARPLSSQPPDCNLAAKRWDNPISDHGGFVMRRYQWTLAYAGASLVAYRLLRMKLSPAKASTTTTLVLGTLPHVRGLIRHQYPISLDFVADLWTRSAPAWFVIGQSGGIWQSRFLAGTTYGLGQLVVMCYASP
jgi:hypothetical protein